MFCVIYPDSPHYGDVLTRHRTRAAAERQIERERTAFRRSPHGQRGGWIEREIVECGRRETRVRRNGPAHV